MIDATAAATIHIIDDEASVRTALSRLLTVSGFRVTAYESAAHFLDRSFGDTFGCILLDVNMPGLSGIQLQEQLRQTQDTLPIIFLTGHGDIPMSVRAIKAGAEDFLAKPVDKSGLLDAVERALARSRKAHERQGQTQALEARHVSLTAREQEVFNLLILGMLNKQIAFELGNTERTVKAHRHSIMEKMQVKSVAELVVIATQLGVMQPRTERVE
jgi:FixJ family two-component response regulator